MTEINVNRTDYKTDKSIDKNVKKGVDMVAKIEKKITTDINVNKGKKGYWCCFPWQWQQHQ